MADTPKSIALTFDASETTLAHARAYETLVFQIENREGPALTQEEIVLILRVAIKELRDMSATEKELEKPNE